ncbi:YybH family protein [Tamlana flava]|uniref:YybH family protein n=1 Tax=Tamlana flava TaxID=3158572 RepID=UPI00351B7181
MKTIKFTLTLSFMFFLSSIIISSCNQKSNDKDMELKQTDLSVLEKEIELQLREFEKNLQNGDSIALGNMYMADAVIMPSTVGRENIVKNFGSMIRDSITGSSFDTTGLWGNDQLLVEEGKGTWFHANGQIVGRGKYLVVWKKDNENWKILRDIWFPEKKK